MGRMLGAFDPDNNIDRPDLNKCPDCECFFAGDNCPLCGKECPEEMRAGNRKPVKQDNRRRRRGSDRVTFIEWYHSWWFIILTAFFSPIISIILLITSPHKKSIKITVVVVLIAYFVVTVFGVGLVQELTGLFDKPVDASLSREEYVSVCQAVGVETYYRSVGLFEEEFVTMTLTVVERTENMDGYYGNEKYNTYYICSDADGKFKILIRDCSQDGLRNYIPGDVITVYGEGAGNCSIFDEEYNAYSAPCVNAAYIVVE